jgi:hypothetical protein
MTEDMPWVNLTQEEVKELRNKKHELTEYGKQKLRKLMNKDLIFYTNGKETSRMPTPTLETLTLGTKAPEINLEIKMTEPIEAKVSEEDFNKIVDAFNNPQPYPDEMFEEAERRGYSRAHKHVENPTEDAIIEAVEDAVMSSIYEYFTFEDHDFI